jgi:hypothetical protein
MTTVLQLGYLLTVIATAAALVFGYFRRRNLGFLVLLLALPVWSFVERASRSLIEQQVESAQETGRAAFPFIFGGGNLGEMLVRYFFVNEIIQGSLVLVGILLLAFGPRISGSRQVHAAALPDSDLDVPA